MNGGVLKNTNQMNGGVLKNTNQTNGGVLKNTDFDLWASLIDTCGLLGLSFSLLAFVPFSAAVGVSFFFFDINGGCLFLGLFFLFLRHQWWFPFSRSFLPSENLIYMLSCIIYTLRTALASSYVVLYSQFFLCHFLNA